MKVRIPQKIKIGATPAFIKYQENLMSDEGFHGTFNRRTGELTLEAGCDGAKRDKTFGHELMEVIKENYNLTIAEADMSNIANGWLEFLNQLGIEFDFEDIKICQSVKQREKVLAVRLNQ